MKIALVSLNPIVGDFTGNLEKVLAFSKSAEKAGANLVVFPELALIGYPPQDLILRTSFGAQAEAQLAALSQGLAKLSARPDFAVLVGTALPSPEGCAQPLINAAVFCQQGKQQIRAKSLIPHYDIFHERRYFESALNLPAEFRAPIEFCGEKIGVLICEDSWHETKKYGHKLYQVCPSQELAKQGATVLVNISASPFSADKRGNRHAVVVGAARAFKLPLLYVNNSGANDEIIFDGDRFAVDAQGKITAQGKPFCEEMLLVDLKKSQAEKIVEPDRLAQIYGALVTGIRDYASKNKFKTAVLGLSGGIDSALVACLAVDALGAQNVFGFTLPSKFSSSHSISDAEALAKNLGIRCQNLSIKFLQSTLELALKPYFAGKPEDITEENLQSRLRGLLLMAMANKMGHLLLATANKSELAVGYSTLYGDMCGGLAPIGDLFKTDVYALSQYLNRNGEIIPGNTLQKAPSAELRPNQTDQDSLPPYDLLDRMLHYFIEEEMSFAECEQALISDGIRVDSATLRDVEKRIWTNEFKRNQFAPILRVSAKAFGIGRRYPITKRIPEFLK